MYLHLVMEKRIHVAVQVFLDRTRIIWAGSRGTRIKQGHSGYMREQRTFRSAGRHPHGIIHN